MDPIGNKDDPILYMYVGLDPVNRTDPTGLQWSHINGAFQDGAQSIRHPEGWAIVQAHGSEDGTIFGRDGQPIDAAGIMRDLAGRGYRPGTPIILLICNADQNGVNTAYAYETDSDLSQLNHMWAPGAGQTPATFGFQHDGAGRITLTQVNRSDLEWMPTLAEAASYGVPTNLPPSGPSVIM